MLKTTNYKNMPIAYAIIDKIYVNKNKVVAVFGIYESREQSQQYNSVETKSINFEWDRKADIAMMAYIKAKQENAPFYGWLDDFS
jgi:hypothetical protein